MFSLEELWVKLTTPQIGFYTLRRAGQIPVSPGVYAWFLPLWLRRSPEQLLANTRQILTYDSQSGGPGKWEAHDAGFRWDPLHVEVSRQTVVPGSAVQEQIWRELMGVPPEVDKRFRLALMASSIFAKPLYVGLSNNLRRRHGEHATVGSTFRERFEGYMRSVRLEQTVQDLLFVCIPLARPGGGEDEYTDGQIRSLEYILKIICQPAFGDL